MPPVSVSGAAIDAVPPAIRRRLTGTLFLSQSLFSAATIAAFTLTPVLAAQLGGGDAFAGLPSTLTLLGRALVALPFGWLMDRAGRRPGLSLGYLLGVLGMALSAGAIMAGSFAGLLLGAVLVGAARAAAEQSRFVAAEVQPAAARARAIGVVVFAGTLGAVGGPLLVDPAEQLALTAGLAGGAGPFLVAGGLLTAALLLTTVFLRPDPLEISRLLAAAELAPRSTGERAWPARRPLRQVFAGRTVQLAVLAMVVGQLVMTMLMVIAPVHMEHHHHTTRDISWVIMAHTLGMFGLSGVTGWLIDRLGRVVMIGAGAATLIGAALLSPLSSSVPVLGLALFLLGLGWNFCYVAGSSLLSDALTAEERGRAQGANESLVALAAGLGSAGSGVVFAWRGITAVSGAGIIATMGLVGFLVFWLRTRTAVSPAEALQPAESQSG